MELTELKQLLSLLLKAQAEYVGLDMYEQIKATNTVITMIEVIIKERSK